MPDDAKTAAPAAEADEAIPGRLRVDVGCAPSLMEQRFAAAAPPPAPRPGPRERRIGDVEPMPVPVDRDLLDRLAARRERTAMLAAEAEAAGELTPAQERARRAACPVEQAKNHLRRRGYVVFCASVVGRAGVVVGKSVRSEAEMLALARRLGWRPEEPGNQGDRGGAGTAAAGQEE